MPQQDDEAAELKHAEKIGFVILPTAHESTENLEPSEETLDFPAVEGSSPVVSPGHKVELFMSPMGVAETPQRTISFAPDVL
jgi:hypothetical protein